LIKKAFDYYKKVKNTQKFKKSRNNYQTKKRKNDIDHRFRDSISGGIYKALKGNKKGRKWENIVNYTLDELKANLSSKFQKNMNWNNYGKWEIDHIIPLKYKNKRDEYYWDQKELKNPSSETFKNAWKLDNLQPMWKKDNIKKGNRFIS